MNKDIVVIKYISDDESRKFILTVREKSISFEDFDNSMNCDQCNEKDTCELYTTLAKVMNISLRITAIYLMK